MRSEEERGVKRLIKPRLQGYRRGSIHGTSNPGLWHAPEWVSRKNPGGGKFAPKWPVAQRDNALWKSNQDLANWLLWLI